MNIPFFVRRSAFRKMQLAFEYRMSNREFPMPKFGKYFANRRSLFGVRRSGKCNWLLNIECPTGNFQCQSQEKTSQIGVPCSVFGVQENAIGF